MTEDISRETKGETPEVKAPKRKPLGLKLDEKSLEDKASETCVRQNLSHGRSKTVTVEVRSRRIRSGGDIAGSQDSSSKLTNQEQSLRFKAVQEALQHQLQEMEVAVAAAEAEKHRTVETPLEDISISSNDNPLPFSENQETPFVPLIQIEAVAPFPAKEELGAHRHKRGYVEKDTKVTPLEDKLESRKRSPSVGPNKGKVAKKIPEKTVSVKTEDDAPVIDRRTIVGLKKMRKRSQGKRAILSSVGSRCAHIPSEISVQELASQLALKTQVLVRALTKMGVENPSPNYQLDADTAECLTQELGHTSMRIHTLDEEEILWSSHSGDNTQIRPPIVTVMGHVDHGKTSLLDALRKTDVTVGEAGGITQHIGAYTTLLPSGKRITFIDTPGHKSFSQMRARGAQLTDIVVLVVAADDGINAQTVEAIHHAQSAGTPLLVAINKIDKPGAKPDRVREQLLSHNIVVEKLGGDVLDVEISALKGTNLDKLEEAILLQAEILGLGANAQIPARGVVLETHMKKGRGVVATILVQNGTLRAGDFCVAGSTYGRARLLFDDKDHPVKMAGPSTPVEVCGLNSLPKSGERFMVVDNEAKAKEFVAWKIAQRQAAVEKISVERLSLEEQWKIQHQEDLPLIIKADVQGSLEGLDHELSQLRHDEVALKVVHQAIGPINESDVALAQASNAVIVGFNVAILPAAKKMAEQEKIPVLLHRIIYHAVDDIKDRLTGMLKPEYREEALGTATVLQIFTMSRGKISKVVGCSVLSGILKRGSHVRILRNGTPLYTTTIDSLYHLKNEVKEMRSGYECGIGLKDFQDILPQDHVECFSLQVVPRTL